MGQWKSKQEKPETDPTLVGDQSGQPVTDSRRPDKKALEGEETLLLVHVEHTNMTACNQLRRRLKIWAQDQGWEDERINQVWSTLWEAIQNGIKYGSRSGDAIQIRLISPGKDGRLGVELKQPLPWKDWEKKLGERRRRRVHTAQALMGGTVTMLWLADEIQVEDLGRQITMWFSPAVVPARKIDVTMEGY